MEDTNFNESQTVPIDQASEQDLEAFILNYQEPTEEEAEIPPTPQQTPQAPVTDAQDQASKTAEPAKAAPAEDYEKLKAKNAQLRAALEKQTLYVQRRSTEIGDLRKALREANTRLAQGLQERFIEDPEQAIEHKLQIRSNEEHINQLDAEEQALQGRHSTMNVVTQYVPEEEFDLQAMAQSLQRDGVHAQAIQSFLSDPYSQTSGVTLVQLAKRAHAEKLLTSVYNYARQLEEEVKNLKGKPEQVLRDVDKLAKSKPMTAATGGSMSKPKSVPNVSVDQMSDAELQEYIRQSRRG